MPTADSAYRFPRPETPLAFTGERLTPDIEGQIALEHFHRYALARDLSVGCDVLDVAAGEGYGAAMLAGVARSVIGVEIDAAAVAHARVAYPLPNLRYLEGDATRMPLPDACVDIVVSFETLEHLRDQEAFLREVRRVLRPGGLFLVSTPDRAVYSAPGQPSNPYHVRELTRPEFADLLGAHFANHRILAQRALIGSVLAPLDAAGGEWRSYDSRPEGVIQPRPGLAQAFYLIGIASDGPLPQAGASVFTHNVSLDDTLRSTSLLDRERLLRQQAEADLDAAWQQAAHLAARLEEIRTSILWRATGPFRVLGRRFPRLERLGQRAARIAGYALRGELPQRLREWREARAVRARMARQDMRAALGLPPPITGAPAPDSINLPTSSAPEVSVIIPIYGQVDHTLRCLASIAAAPPARPIEVLVVEDASGDPRIAELEGVRGLRLVRWPENLGFLRSCNAAAKLAQGRKLFFLNNDTEVMPGAIDALAALLDARPDAGMAGARLLYPDGTLQEAGGIVWRDGSAWNYGNRDDPRRHEYTYVREADYVSGAAIMLPRARWEEMGGFDELFLPAYCEDSDLAFRLRDAGWKVLYEPRATVIHHEGVSHGTDTGAGIKAHQVANTQKLAARWGRTLAREAQAPGERIMRARDRAAGRRITLVIDHYVPEPDRDAGSRTMLAFMEALVATGRCVKFLPDNLYRTPGYAERLEGLGIEVVHAPWTDNVRTWLARNGAELDEVLLSRPGVAAKYMPLVRAHSKAPIVFYGHDLHAARMRLVPGALNDPARREEIGQMETIERSVWRLADMVLYPSDEEVLRVRALEPLSPVRAIPPYALPAPHLRKEPVPATGGLIFVGGFRHEPNVDAATWLAGEILPLVRRGWPEARLVLVGSNPTPGILALNGPGVEVRASVQDDELNMLYAAARVAVCPLRVGAGVKLKVVEAMHRGVPVVTTRIGAQGLPGVAEVCDVAETAADIAAGVVRLLSDDALWLARSAAQARYVAESFSPETMRAGLEEAFAAAARRTGR